MIAWRSRDLPNTLAAALCLASIGLAAKLSAKLHAIKTAHVIAWGWLFAGFINAAVGLVQYFGLLSEPLGTAFGLLRQRNQLATLCNIALLSLLYLWLCSNAKPSAKLTTPLALAACALLTAALAATCSRAGLLELFTLCAFALVWAKVKRRRDVLAAAILALLTYVLWASLLPLLSGSPETIFGRVVSLAAAPDGATEMQLQDSRRLLWTNTLALIRLQPLLGVGWRELAHALQTTDLGSLPRFADQADNAHSLPLQFAAELGLPFTVLWFGLLTWLFLRHRPWRAYTSEQVLAWGVLAVIGLHSLLEYPLWYAPFQIAVGLSAGALFSQTKSAASHTDNTSASLIWHGLASICLLCFCAYAAIDYHRIRQLFITADERSALYQGGAYAKAEASWLFASQVRFAKLTTTPVTPNNAAELWQLGHEVLHFSPEPLVFQTLISAGAWLAPHDPKIAAELLALQK
jgi:O-antigen ligase